MILKINVIYSVLTDMWLTEDEKKEIAAEEELSKSERYRRNVAKFVEQAKKAKE